MKALSGVAHAKGRFGKTMIAQMLTGSGSEKMDRWGLKRLSTYGILSEFRQTEVIQILDALDASGLVECPEVDRFRPVVHLTEAGWSLLRSQSNDPIVLTLPDELMVKVRNGGLERVAAKLTSPPRAGESPEDETDAGSGPGSEPSPFEGDPLWDRLKSLRHEWAREARQPAYCVFSNQTLEALVRSRPQTPQALAGIKGLGPARLERYGAALLKAIGAVPEVPAGVDLASSVPLPAPPVPRREESLLPPFPHANPPPQEGRKTEEAGVVLQQTPAQATPSAASYVPTEEWTWRLLDRGFTIEETAAIRGVTPTIVIRHLTWMARQGRSVAIDTVLDAETIERWETWHHEHGDSPPPSEAPDDVAFWPLFLASRA